MADKELSFRIRAINATRAGITAAGQSFRRLGSIAVGAARRAQRAFAGIGSFIARQARRAAVGLGLVSIASIKLAADAEEAASKFEVVFGDAADSVTQDMEKFAKVTGRSADSMRFLAGDVGDMVKAMGFAESEAADLSVALVKLATDTASFKNAQTADVVLAFTSALTGERESLKRLGAYFTEAELKAKLASKGIVEATNDFSDIEGIFGSIGAGGNTGFTAQEKAVATLEILQEKLADAQGDTERTAASLTNQYKSFVDTLKDAGREIGKQLADGLELADMFGTLSGKVREWVASLKESGALESFAENVRSAFGVALDFIDKLSTGGDVAKSALRDLANIAGEAFGGIGETLSAAIVKHGPAIGEAIAQGMASAAKKGYGSVTSAAGEGLAGIPGFQSAILAADEAKAARARRRAASSSAGFSAAAGPLAAGLIASKVIIVGDETISGG